MAEQAQQGGTGVSRRGFMRAALTTSFLLTLGGVLAPVLGYLWPPRRSAAASGGRVQVATLDEIPEGKGKIVSYAGKPVILVNAQDEGEVKAFSAICTHLGCIVSWCEEHQYIHCYCHDGIFDTNGQVISGPPPSPLAPYTVMVEGDKVYITG